MNRRLLLTIAILAAMTGAASEVWAISSNCTDYRWRNDDGGETNATWQADKNQEATFATNMNIRVRLSVEWVENLNGTMTWGGAWNLQYTTDPNLDINGYGAPYPWIDVKSTYTTQAFVMASSPWFANGQTTTDQLAGDPAKTFAAGRMVEHPSNANPTFTYTQTKRTNLEYCFRPTPNAALNTQYRFRLNGPYNPNTGFLLHLIRTEPAGDVNGDGVVNEADLNVVISNFGRDYR